MQSHIIRNFYQLMCTLVVYGSKKVSTSRIKSGWFNLERNRLIGIIKVKKLKMFKGYATEQFFIDYEKGNLTDIVKNSVFLLMTGNLNFEDHMSITSRSTYNF